MKLLIYRTDAHDHAAIYLNGRQITVNDFGYENLLKIAKELDWEVKIQNLTREQFEEKFC